MEGEKPSPCCTPKSSATAVTAASAIDGPRAAETPEVPALIELQGGVFLMGSDNAPHPLDGEGPRRQVTVSPFYISATAVSYAEFAQFVQATHYLTWAERRGSSFVFKPLEHGVAVEVADANAPWWQEVAGASWRNPTGATGVCEVRPDSPVVHLALGDALAYCRWSGTRLPSEAEWEYAALGGVSTAFPWGEELEQDGLHHCNVWQGDFPRNNTAQDGFTGTAPVRAFSANAFGLFNMNGNVWEWVADRFTALHSPRPTVDPRGPLNGESYVAKGGSYLCHPSYCSRYRCSSRQALDPEITTDHIGFRVAR